MHLPQGAITTLIGPNGLGKSTLLKVCTKLLAPTHGTVVIDGQNIAQLSTREMAKRMAILPQGPVAPANLTVRDLVEQGRYAQAGPFRMLRRQDHAAITRAIDLVNLTELADRDVDTLSDYIVVLDNRAIVAAGEPVVDPHARPAARCVRRGRIGDQRPAVRDAVDRCPSLGGTSITSSECNSWQPLRQSRRKSTRKASDVHLCACRTAANVFSNPTDFRTYAVGVPSLRQSGILHFNVCGFSARSAEKTAHKRSARTMLPQAKSVALRCGTTQLRNSHDYLFTCALRHSMIEAVQLPVGRRT